MGRLYKVFEYVGIGKSGGVSGITVNVAWFARFRLAEVFESILFEVFTKPLITRINKLRIAGRNFYIFDRLISVGVPTRNKTSIDFLEIVLRLRGFL